MRRRLLVTTAAVVVVLLVAVATVPWWLGSAVGAAGRSRGLTFAAYERIGYARFALKDVSFERPGVRVTVSRAEVDTPVLWLWRHWRGQPSAVVADAWAVDVPSSSAPRPPATRPRGWLPLRTQLQRIASQLDRWLPRAQTGPGVVRFPGGQIAASSVKWSNRELATTSLAFRGITANATVAFPSDADLIRFAAETADGLTRTTLESRGADVSGDVIWSEQRAALAAKFDPQGWLPREAQVNASDWEVAGSRLKLGEAYSLVRGSARVEWRDARIAASVQATGEPTPGKAAPPLQVDLRGEGDAQAFTIASLRVTLPGIRAVLSEPVTVERNGRLRGFGAQLALEMDLAAQPWFPASGAVTGNARVVSSDTPAPVVDFLLEATNVSARDIALASATARGRLTWPQLEISEATIVTGEGERLELRGGWDFKSRAIVDARVEGEIRRRSLARVLPKQPDFDVVSVRARASGTLEAVEHDGQVASDAVTFSGLNPIALALSWRGRGPALEQFTANATAGATRIVAEGSLDRAALQLTGFEFTQGNEPRLKLAAPARVVWSPTLQLESLQLTGPKGNLSASGSMGESGKFQIAAANISSRWLADLVPPKGPAWQLSLLALIGTWDRGPMIFSLTAGTVLEMGEGRTAALNAAAKGDKDGLRIDALRVTEGDATVVNATGHLPITLTPGEAPVLRIDERGTIALRATAEPNAVFWQKLAALSGVELKEPQALADVGGTWRRPEGTVSFKAARLAVDPKRVARPLPALEAIDVKLTADPAGVVLDHFTLNVEGQPVRARGRLPVPEEKWSTLLKEPLAAVRRGADLQVELPEADVAVFARFLPRVLAPKGRIQASIGYRNDGLDGFVRLRDAATKPLGPLGVLQEVSAEIEMKGRTLLLREVSARTGGQPVELSGSIELPAKGEPRFDLTLKGENLPFVRQTGLLVRGDLDLKLQSPGSGPPRLTGTVRLRDSLFLSDVRSFIPSGGASASRRPPYFSVDTPPVNTWGLAVEVTGEEFLRLRTPVFSGVASAHFRLSGTLGEPRAIGEVEIEEGLVRMPFARFEVQQGFVRLTEADPYEPTLYIRGTGRRYGYDLTVEVDGKASAPNVMFTSSPALESEDVLLMVMTGSAPSNEIAVTGTQRVTRLGTFVGQNLLSSFTSDGSEADRLSITSGEKISRQGKETYDIEYKLSDRWTVTGEYTEFDEYNAGMKWRVLRGEAEKEKTESSDTNSR